MKLSTSKKELLEKLSVATRAVSTRSAIQALSGVFIEASEGVTTVKTTDMQVALQLRLNAEIQSDGKAILPCRLLNDITKSLPGESVSIEVVDDVALVRSGSASFKVKRYQDDDFPTLPSFSRESSIGIPGAALCGSIAKVAGSASRDDARPILTGIKVSIDKGKLVMVATDSYRLGVITTNVEQIGESFEATVPARALQELVRVVGSGADGTVRVCSVHNHVVFEYEGVVLSSRLIDGQFPDYRQLLPGESEHEFTVGGEELLEVVRRVGLMAQKNSPLRLRVTGGLLEVSANTVDVGEATDSIPVRYKGAGIEIGFNPEFLREGLESSLDGNVTISLTNALRPGLLQSTEDDAFKYVIMPVRLNV